MKTKFSKELQEKCEKLGRQYCEDTGSMYFEYTDASNELIDAHKAGFKAALTKEVLAQVPEVMKLLDTLEAVIDNTGMTYEQADFANKAIVLGALKPWAKFIKEQE